MRAKHAFYQLNYTPLWHLTLTNKSEICQTSHTDLTSDTSKGSVRSDVLSLICNRVTNPRFVCVLALSDLLSPICYCGFSSLYILLWQIFDLLIKEMLCIQIFDETSNTPKHPYGMFGSVRCHVCVRCQCEINDLLTYFIYRSMTNL